MSAFSRELRLAAGIFLLALVALYLTRAPLAPKTLFHFDAGNFILALTWFNPAISQPHLPGYPLFILLLRLLDPLFLSSAFLLLFAGLLGGAAALSLLFLLARRMFGTRAAWLSLLILLLNPVFYAAGLTNPNRVFLSAVSLTAACCAWWAWQGASPVPWAVGGALLTAFVCGFRPEMLLFTAPLIFSVIVVRRLSWRVSLTIVLAWLAGWLPWALYTIKNTGGAASFWRHLTHYLRAQTQADSLVSGAALPSALILAEKAVVWTFFSFLPFLILFAVARFPLRLLSRPIAWFFALWFLPAFAFHLLMHIGDPDHALATIPGLSLLAAGMADLWLEQAPSAEARARRWLAFGAAVAAAYAFFALPMPRLLRQVSYPEIRYYANRYESLQYALHEFSQSHRLALLCYDSEHNWRNLAAFFFSAPVVMLPEPPLQAQPSALPDAPATPFYFLHARAHRFSVRDGEFLLPPVDLIVWPFSVHAAENQARLTQDGFRRHFLLYTREVAPGESFQVGAYRFRVAHQPD